MNHGRATLPAYLVAFAWVWIASFCSIAPLPAQPDDADAATPAAESIEPILPWLGTATSHPLEMRITHAIEYDPLGRGLEVESSDWRLAQLNLACFGGTLGLVGSGRVRNGSSTDLATTITLNSINLREVLEFLSVPRANEVEAIVDGGVGLAVEGKQWRWMSLDVRSKPGTARISRGLLRDLLIPYTGGALSVEQLDAALGHYYGVETMLPLADAELVGTLSDATLNLKIPIRNQALNIMLEPRIERAILWEIWRFIKSESLQNVKDVQWDLGTGKN